MDLMTDSGLVAAIDQAISARRSDSSFSNWTASLAERLSEVRSATEETFRSERFQKTLWESEAISATGLGRVPTARLWTDAELVGMLWQVRNIDDETDPASVTMQLARLWDAAIARIKTLSDRVPRLKLARVFASLRPQNFTTLADGTALDQLARGLGVGSPGEHKVVLHQKILNRLDEVLDRIQAPPSEPRPILRLKLPWLLYFQSTNASTEGATLTAGEKSGDLELRPLPANRRRRGLLAIAGYLQSILAMIQFLERERTREDFRAHIRAVNPKLADGSINTNINALIAEWGVVAANGDRLSLTPRGVALLESGEPEEVSDWLLTQILGFDNSLYLLKEQSLEQKAFISQLQTVNPGWTTNFAPTAMLGWLRGLGLIELGSDRLLKLTERGKEWANRIHWVPGVLEKSPSAVLPQASTPESSNVQVFIRPTVDQIAAAFPSDLVFEKRLIAQLDAALWSHHRRHFVVLTGLSGSGKTQLACSYAAALWAGEDAKPRAGTYVLPVQPGWHDPTPLLGYVNPLNTEQYVRTPFLNFLLDAVRDPERPYTVILDEMNLSHPEQYLAPLLSAMETGGQIDLHSQDDDVDEIPSSVLYPRNLLIIGTVNMDETTHGLSDKVLDRASVIEFWDIDTDDFPGWQNDTLGKDHVEVLRSLIRDLGKALSPARLHFGWRTIGDVQGYVGAALSGGAISFDEAMDQAIYAKVLPKLRGEDSPRLKAALANCASALEKRALALSLNKVRQLAEDLERMGTARFWR